MSGQVLDLTIIVYGSSENDPNDDSRFSGYNQRRVELEFRPPVPKADMLGNVDRMMTWAKWSIIELLQDIKHSQKWHCEFCGMFEIFGLHCARLLTRHKHAY